MLWQHNALCEQSNPVLGVVDTSEEESAGKADMDVNQLDEADVMAAFMDGYKSQNELSLLTGDFQEAVQIEEAVNGNEEVKSAPQDANMEENTESEEVKRRMSHPIPSVSTSPSCSICQIPDHSLDTAGARRLSPRLQ